MAYGILKCDNITFDNGGSDQNVTVSGLYRATTSGVTVTGTISGAVLVGTTTVSGATVTGNIVQGTTVQGVSGTFTSLTGTTTTGTTANFASGVFTTRVSGTIITGDTGQFTSGTFVSLTGTTITGTTINAVTVSSTTGTFTSLTGTTITGTTINGVTVAATTGSFTSLTGTTTSGTTANFVSGVFTTQVSGTTVTGTTSNFTSGNFATLSGATATFTSGVIALGTATNPSLSFVGDPNTGIYSPGADQLAVATNGAGRLFVDASGNVSINNSTAFGNTLYVAGNINAASTIRTDVGSGVTSLILAGVGSNFQVSHPTAGIVNVLNSGGGFTFTTDSGEKVRITSAGLVGIGTSAPSELVHVSTVSSTSLRIAASSPGSAVSPNSTFIKMTGFNNNPRVQIESQDKAANFNGGFLNIATANSSNTLVNALHIDNAQRVGIGTTSPTDTLNISSSANQIGLDTGNQATYGTLDIGHFANGAFIGTQAGSDAASNLLRLGTSGIERARIDSSGRLLVGTSSDSGGALLQVNGDRIRVGTAKTPATSGATGAAGEIAWDADYIYVCTAANTWKRVAIATW